jgi:L-fuconolactonase
MTEAAVDAHHHLLYPDEREYAFAKLPAYRKLDRRFDVDHLREAIEGTTVERAVVVQTQSSTEETERFLREAAEQPLIAGVVGWVDLTRDGVGDEVRRLRELPGGEHLCGIRHLVHDEPDPDWLVQPAVLAGLRELAESGLPYDLLLRPRELPTAIAAADAVPELRMVVDHIAKPRIGAPGAPIDEEWADGLRALAEREQVWCKLSGMVTEMRDGEPWSRAAIAPYIDRVLEWYGPSRLMYGSDWPVCLIAAEYADVFGLARDHVERALSPDEQRLVLRESAIRFYALAPA